MSESSKGPNNAPSELPGWVALDFGPMGSGMSVLIAPWKLRRSRHVVYSRGGLSGLRRLGIKFPGKKSL